MSAFVDTSVLVRHLVGDPPAMAKRATSFLRSADHLFLTDLIVAETIYVLESFYEVDRQQVAESMRSLIAMNSIAVIDTAQLLRALEIYELHRIDFAESYLIASAESTDVAQIASFDRSMDRVKTVTRVES